MLATPSTKRSTPKLSDLARKVVAPKGVVATGWPAVERKCSEFGITFRPWQPDVGRLILAKRDDGKYAATIGGTGLSIPRQVGKTFLVGAIVFALCLLRPNLTVIWTAHRLRTAEETFGKMQVFAKRRGIKPHIAKLVLGSGEEEVRFLNGSRILFGARESGFGLGFDEVDVLIFDEAQRLKDMTLDDMIPATNQSRQETGALLLFMGTPPRPTDPGDVFRRMRTEALTGEDDDTAWVEFGADPDFTPTPPPLPLTAADWAQVAKANPSYPEDTPREAILRMRKKLGPESYLREGLGIWDEDDDEKWVVLPKSTWQQQCRWDPELDVPTSHITGAPVFGIDVARDRSTCTIAAAGTADDGVQFEVAEHGAGTAWVVDKCVQLGKKHGTDMFVVDALSEAKSLISDLEDANLRVEVTQARDMVEACGWWYDAVTTGEAVHLGHEAVDKALAGAAWRELEASRALGRKKSTVDISPLIACVLAMWGHRKYGEYDLLDSIN